MRVFPAAQSGAKKRKPARFLRVAVSLGVLLAAFAGALAVAFVIDITNGPQSRARNAKAFLEDHGFGKNHIKSPFRTLGRAVSNAIAYRSAEDLPVLEIDVKFDKWQEIAKTRVQALQQGNGFMLDPMKRTVPATLRFGDRVIDAKIRLKGDRKDHWEARKRWSLSIKLRNGSYLYGMRRFSIQHPRTRGYDFEPLFLEHAKQLGLIVPKYLFVDVVVNGEPQGVMALEESVSKALLENSGRREGVISRFDESLGWRLESRLARDGQDFKRDDVYENFHLVPLELQSKGRIAKSAGLQKMGRLSKDLIWSLQLGYLDPKDIFDLREAARFVALSDLWGTYHPMSPNQLRFYLDPVTLKFTFVIREGFDASVADSWPHEHSSYNQFQHRLFAEPAFMEVFRQERQAIFREMIDGPILDILQRKQNEMLPALKKNYPPIKHLDLAGLRWRARHILEMGEAYYANPSAARKKQRRMPAHPRTLPRLVEPTLYDVDGRVYLDVANYVGYPVRISDITIRWKDGRTKVLENELMLPPTYSWVKPDRWKVEIPASAEELRTADITARADVQHEDSAYRASESFYVGDIRKIYRKHPLAGPDIRDVIAQFPFLRVEPDEKVVSIRPGTWRVERPVLLPEKYALRAGPGTRLQFDKGAFLKVAGPVTLQGSAEAPIVLEGAEADGARADWWGLLAIDAGQPSKLSHVVIRGTNSPRLSELGWAPTGAVTFVNSPVTIANVTFDGTQAEDALNLIHSPFTILETEFRGTRSDAFDADFSNGQISNSRFTAIGGDGIDVSGSKITVANVEIDQVHDKGVSLGEAATAHIEDLHVSRCGTGIVSKDASKGFARRVVVENCSVASVMAYVKKPQYGFASLEVTNLTSKNVPRQIVVQKGSRVVIDEQQAQTVDLDVKRLYQSGPMAK